MSFIDKILSGQYPQIEKLFQKEFGKVVDEVFGLISSDFEELDEFEPAKKTQDDPDGKVSLAAYDRVTDLLEDERRRCESLKRELDIVKKEKATLQHKLDAARHELST